MQTPKPFYRPQAIHNVVVALGLDRPVPRDD